jgi:hypothetical protein
VHLADILEESQTHQRLLVLIDWNLSHFEQEIQQKHRHWSNVLIQSLEQVSKLFSSNIDEIGLSDFIGLVPDPVFTFDVVVFAHELKELEGSSVGDDAFLVIDLFVCVGGFENVFPEDVFFVDVVEVVVVDGSGGEDVVGVLFDVAIVDVFEDEFAEF